MVVWAFAVSLVVHVAAVLLYPVMMDRVAPDPDAPPDPATDWDVPRIVLIEPVEPEDVDPPLEEPEVEVPLPDPEPILPPPVAEEEVADVDPGELPAEPVEEEEPLTAAERLRPRMGTTPELWTFSDPEALELTREERAQLRIRVAIQELGDSLTAEEERQLEAVNWTYTDEDGEEWGISPGTLHLGGREIPLPFAFTPPPGQQDAADQMEWELWEFGAPHSLQNVRGVWRDRIDAIRERRDTERADTTGNPP